MLDGGSIQEMKGRLPNGHTPFELIIGNVYIQSHDLEDDDFSPEDSARKPDAFMEDFLPCDCRYSENAVDMEAQACGERSNCINRSLSVECNADDCPCRDRCQNQRFQKHQFADIEVFETPGKGYGLRTLQDLSSNHFVIEYVGEVVDQDEFERRAEQYADEGQRHHYFMTLQNDRIIDATRKGNLSRFMNHSCNPNCATQKWIVNGQLRIGLFTKRKIKAGTELTFDYKFIRFGATAQKCLCGEANCKGVIGEEQKETVRSVTKSTQQEEEDAEEALERFPLDGGVQSINDLPLLCRLLLKTESADEIEPLIGCLLRTTDSGLLKKFVALHGLQLLNIILGLHWRNTSLVSKIADLLSSLPISNRNIIEDSHIEEKLERILHRDDIESGNRDRLKLLIDTWASLDRPYRIPKAIKPIIQESMAQEGSSVKSPAAPSQVVAATFGGYSLSGPRQQQQSRWSSSSHYHLESSPTRNSRTEEERRQRHLDERPSRSDQSHFDRKRTDRGDQRDFKKHRSRREMSPPSAPAAARQQQNDPEQRLQEIIERAKQSVLLKTREPASSESVDVGFRSPAELVSSTSGHSSDDRGGDWRTYEVRLKEKVSPIVQKYLKRWCGSQMPDPNALRELVRKLTLTITDKEIRTLRRDFSSPPSDLLDDLTRSPTLPSSKVSKMKNFLAQYLTNHGYRLENYHEASSSLSHTPKL